MRIAILALVSLTLGACASQPSSPVSATRGPVHGDYVEARTVNVFVGACHYAAEYSTEGSEALLAWRLKSGAEGGVELAGLNLAAIVLADTNLAEGTPRRSVILLDSASPESQRAAGLLWLQKNHGESLGSVTEVRVTPLTVERSGDHFEVRANHVELRADLLKNRDCCTMPHLVWYQPIANVRQPIVGSAETFRCADERIERSWSIPTENCVMAASF